MRKWLYSVLLLTSVIGVLLAGALSTARGAPTARQVAFKASYRGKLDILVRPSGLQMVAWAQGKATLLGASVLLATGPTEQPRPGCWQFSGLASLIGSKGDRLYLALGQPRNGCRLGPASTIFPASAEVQVMGGTGIFAKAAGQLKMTSSGDSITSGITLKYAGTLSY
jgi:hypothetical protein